jgi:hypothetical protein
MVSTDKRILTNHHAPHDPRPKCTVRMHRALIRSDAPYAIWAEGAKAACSMPNTHDPYPEKPTPIAAGMGLLGCGCG